jgi:aspartyl-tRNA(Asn)/glutamyl-tRNA(Gln) amidotransferase subunit C
MSVTEEEVRRVSYLARIRMDDSKIHEIQEGLSKIIQFVEQLKEVDCSQVEDVSQYSASLHEREDIAIACDRTVMSNAPARECNMFIVPKVVG